MSFYTSIASYYDLIFPYDEEEIHFLENVIRNIRDRRGYLDIGCATGTFLAEFADRFDSLVGLDLDRELLRLAGEKLFPAECKKTELLEEDMMNLGRILPDKVFSLATCLGNTIPHLVLPGQIELFLRQVFDRLEAGGVFVFQTINYDRILQKGIRGLPTIERGEVTFERYYSAQKQNGLIDFDTILVDPERSVELRNSIELNPVRKKALEEALETAGFGLNHFFGDYAGGTFDSDSYLLIGVCHK